MLFGAASSSVALIGFGLDSLVEVLSAAAVAWQFSADNPEAREKPALKLIAISFFGLAIFVTTSSVLALLGVTKAEESIFGIYIAAVSVLIMPLLSLWERRVGKELGSASAIADSKQTLICSYLSVAVLIGLLLNYLIGWSWADPIAALIIAGFAVREGLEAWRGESCVKPVTVLTGEVQGSSNCSCG